MNKQSKFNYCDLMGLKSLPLEKESVGQKSKYINDMMWENLVGAIYLLHQNGWGW